MPAQIAPDTSQFDFSEYEIEVLLAALTGCAGPGETIDVISSSPATVALEYTHSYSFELGETVKAAEERLVFALPHELRRAERAAKD